MSTENVIFSSDLPDNLTKREFYAALALAGLLSSPRASYTPSELAAVAIAYAESLLEQLEK